MKIYFAGMTFYDERERLVLDTCDNRLHSYHFVNTEGKEENGRFLMWIEEVSNV